MKLYYKIFICGFLGLLLMATGTSAIAAQQNKNAYRNQHSFQKKHQPEKNSLIRPSARRDSVRRDKVRRDKVQRDNVHHDKVQHYSGQHQNYRQNTARDALKSGRIVSLAVIRQRVRKSFPGKIVDVRLKEPRNNNQPYIYMVKVLRKDGKLLELKINAANASIVGVKGNK